MTLREQLLPFLDPVRGLPEAAVDWLHERGASLYDSLKAYATDPPDWLGASWPQDEAFRELLALWCQWTEPAPSAPPDPRERGGVGTLIPRYEMVRLCELNWQALCEDAGYSIRYAPDGVPPEEHQHFARLHLERIAEGGVRSDNPDVQMVIEDMAGQMQRLIASARRQQKRHVLALFPEVQHRRLLRFPLPTSWDEQHRLMAEAEMRLRAGGWRIDVGVTVTQDHDRQEVRYEQVLAAPDWIAPEPSPYWGRSQSTPLEDLRRASQSFIRERQAALPRPLVEEARRRGIGLEGATYWPLEPRMFFGEELRRRGVVRCPHVPPLDARLSARDHVEMRAIETQDVVLDSVDWIEPLPRGRWRRTRYWLGQCPRCRIVYWSECDLGVMPSLSAPG